MPRGPNRHTILSHGGRHGAGGTHLKGSVIPPEQAKYVPTNLTHDVAAPGKPGAKHAASPTTATPNTVAEERAAKAAAATPAALAAKPAEGEKPAEKPPEDVKTHDDVTESQVMRAVKEDEAAEAASTEDDPLPDGPGEGVSIPTSKRQLSRMAKTDAYDLAVELGISVPEADDITAKELRRLLAPKIGL